MTLSLLAVLLSLSFGTFAMNDWTKACLSGVCSYDVEESSTSMGGTIEISGSNSAISDITSAAGWNIANCTDSTNNQTIRLICTDESMGCGHIFQDGAQDTVVRLPEDCGSGPFVRVANHWIPDDQTIPPTLASNMTKRTSTIPQVHMLEIDDDFDKSSGRHGNVSFEIRAQGDLHAGPNKRKRQNGSGFEAASFSIPDNTDFIVFNDAMICPSANGPTNFIFRGDLLVSNVTFSMTVSVISRGTLSPPSITSLSFSAPTNATIGALVQPSLSLQGTINAIDMQLTGVTFPSFSINGIVSINPSFAVIENAVGSVQRFANFVPTANFIYDINNLQFAYPSNSPPASVGVLTPSAPFVMAALPDENSNAQMTMNTTFKLQVQVGAFGQTVDLSVSHNVDYDMDMDASPADGNNEQVCFKLSNRFSLEVANSGPFFQAFSGANTQTIFEEQNTILSTCQTVPLGPSPPTRRARSLLHSRDIFSCPPVAAVPQSVVFIQGNFP